ncbi:MAG: PAS domain-containing protein [Lachnospiraceae bacterium]|nr:PAS domain-containing protein [Lachnospiraceae bacterium]
MNNQPFSPLDAINRISGFHQYILDPPRHLCYAGGNLCRMLGTGEEELLQQDRDGYVSFIHPDDREEYESFLMYLEGSGSLQYRLLDTSGQVIHVIDTITVYFQNGHRMADSVLTNITEQQKTRQQKETGKYLRALSEVYDKIFEFDGKNNIVKCLYGENSPSFQWLQNIPMEMDVAIDNWITSTAAEEDRQSLKEFFSENRNIADDRPERIFYHARCSTGEMRPYAGLFLKLDEDISLFCCRCCQSEEEAEVLRQENDTLKNMQALTMQFTEGMLAFELEDNRVKPLYTSDNMCSFFGYTREQWETLTDLRPTIDEFIAKGGISRGDIETLFSKGETEFMYYDIQRNTYRRIRAICSRKYDGSGKCYVMLHRMKNSPEKKTETLVYIRTFGYFDVFVGEKPIAFRNSKAKELFALLADRKGGFVTSEEAIGFLWENEPANSLTMARYRKVALRLKNTLEEYGVADIIESVNGKRRLVTERVRCDLYEYLSGEEEYAQLFKGSYLSNYSWGESTLAELTGEYL